MRGESCSCPGAHEPLGYCKVKEESLHLQDPDRFLSLRQTQVPLLGLPAEAVGLEEEGDQTGNGGVVADRRRFAVLC